MRFALVEINSGGSSESCSWYENPSEATPCRFESGPGHHPKLIKEEKLTVPEMHSPNLTPEELLTTTRAVRKRLDLERGVDIDIIKECIGVATQAPTGGNTQGWSFVVVADAGAASGARRIVPPGLEDL